MAALAMCCKYFNSLLPLQGGFWLKKQQCVLCLISLLPSGGTLFYDVRHRKLALFEDHREGCGYSSRVDADNNLGVEYKEELHPIEGVEVGMAYCLTDREAALVVVLLQGLEEVVGTALIDRFIVSLVDV